MEEVVPDYTDLTVVCSDGEVRWSQYAMHNHFPTLIIEYNQVLVSIGVDAFKTIIDVSDGHINNDDSANISAIRWAVSLGSFRVAAALVRTFKDGSGAREKIKELLSVFKGEPAVIGFMCTLYKDAVLRVLLAGDVDINLMPVGIINVASNGEDLYKLYQLVKNKTSLAASAEFARVFARLKGPETRKWYSLVIQMMYMRKLNDKCIACMLNVNNLIE